MAKKFKIGVLLFLVGVLLFCSGFSLPTLLVKQSFTLRSSFYTSFDSSKVDRVENMRLAVNSLDKTFIEVGGVFSFNDVVGERTEERGYRRAITIVNGEFVDGIGGGVCQVSTTLYNAFLLADLKVLEYHPHSLAVSYVMPSFDAMVSYGVADLRAENNTNSPMVIRAYLVDNRVKVEIYGEKLNKKIERKSVVLEKISYGVKESYDNEFEYGLKEGERKILVYGKDGMKTMGKITVSEKGETITKIIRKDSYLPIKEIAIIGCKGEEKGKIEEKE